MRISNFIPQFILMYFRRVEIVKVHPPYYNPIGDPSSPNFDYTKYVVKPGDTLFSISQLFGQSLSQTIKDNPQLHNPDLIYPGMVINLDYSFTQG